MQMHQLIQTIALLCQINAGPGNLGSPAAVNTLQRECHTYYAKCLKETQENWIWCVTERK